MAKHHQPIAVGFTSGERDYIRRELDMFFSTYPSVADGFQLKIGRGGPEAGKPKIPLVAEGCLFVESGRWWSLVVRAAPVANGPSIRCSNADCRKSQGRRVVPLDQEALYHDIPPR